MSIILADNNYKIPVFKLTSNRDISNVRITKILIDPEFNTISLNTNCLRWIRRYTPPNGSNSPYIINDSGVSPEEYHLCTLFIEPGNYTIEELMNEINIRMKNSINDLNINNPALQNNDLYIKNLVDSDFLTYELRGHSINITFNNDIMPVTSESIYSNRTNYLEMEKSITFYDNTSTRTLTPIIQFTKNTYSLVNSRNKLQEYKEQASGIDSYFFNFMIDNHDIWDKLGFIPNIIGYTGLFYLNQDPQIDLPVSDVSKLPTYVIKGKYYSEHIYNGPVITGINYDSIAPKGADIFNLSEVMTKLSRRTHFGIRPISLSYPYEYDVRLSQDPDIERYLNTVSTTDNVSSNLIISEKTRITETGKVELIIDSTFKLNYSDLYIYVTTTTDRYGIMKINGLLHAEYLQ